MNQEYETPSPENDENTARPSFGTELRKAREALGQSVDEVASALFVRPQLITALEAEDLSVFSAPVYAMGLLRSYARVLEIRPEPLLAALEGLETGHEPKLVSVSNTTRSAAAVNERRGSIGMIVGAVILLSILGLGLYLSGGDEDDKPAATTSESSGAGTEQGGLAEDLKTPPAGVEPESGGDAATTAVSDSRPDRETADAGDETGDEAGDEAAPVESAKPEASLLLTFETDSWAEVHDAGGRRLLTRIGRAGQKLSLQGQPPFDVRLGYAPGVRIEYNGQPYVWEQRKGSRVAHLKVGVESKP